MSETNTYKKHYRSFFWPIVMLGAGVIWLLTNLDYIPSENLWGLIRLWPALLILAGIDVLFSRRLAIVGALLGIGLIAVVIAFLLFGETLGAETAPTIKTETFSSEMGEAQSANVTLDLSTQESDVYALSDSDLLFWAEIDHIGEINFKSSGDEAKTIELSQIGIENWHNLFLSGLQTEDLTWNIGLSPNLPIDLNVDASTGSADLDLSGLDLESLDYDASTGSTTILLPESAEGYETRLDASTGSMTVVLPADSNLTLKLDGSTGKVTFNAPEGAAIRIEVESGGTGDLQLPAGFTKVSGLDDRDEGVYETEGFDQTEYQILILIDDIGTGNIVVK
jgi:hypothetical protein